MNETDSTTERTNTRHTPGPWEVEGVAVVAAALKGREEWTDKDGQAHSAIKGLIALVYSCAIEGDFERGRFEHNARLIAAAPKMLAALKFALSEASGFACPASTEAVMRAAIDEAEAQS